MKQDFKFKFEKEKEEDKEKKENLSFREEVRMKGLVDVCKERERMRDRIDEHLN